MVAQPRRRVQRIVGLLSLALGCGESDKRPRRDPFEVEVSVEPQPSVEARFARFFMERTSERCEVFIERSGVAMQKLPERFACPKDLELGESVRLLGRTCMRMSPNPARRVPVLCPDYLTTAESEALASASVRQATAAPTAIPK